MPRYSQQDQDDAAERLREWLKPGDTVWCILRHVSRSGMLRVISFHTIGADPDKARILDYNIAQVLGMTHDREREGLRVSGAGMDMGFSVVYELSRRLFPEGFKVEGRGRNGDTSGWDNDGGYALKHRWL